MAENSNKCFSFSVLGWGPRVIYNSDVLEKLRPAMEFQKPQFEFHTFLLFFTPPPISDIVWFFAFFYKYTLSNINVQYCIYV